MRILVPVDGSKQSEKALEYAVKTLSPIKGDFNDVDIDKTLNKTTELFILHVLPQFAMPLGFERPMRSSRTGEVISFSEYINELNETFLDEWKRKLSDYAKKYESKGLLIKTKLLKPSESVVKTIIDVVDKEQIDLIVIGNVGLGGISKIRTLGSVSRSVSEMVKCPVLIIH